MIDIYDNAKAICRECNDIDAIITMIELAEERQDPNASGACLASTRIALYAIVKEIRVAAITIAEKSAEGLP